MSLTITDVFRQYINEWSIPEECDVYRQRLMARAFLQFFGPRTPIAAVTEEEQARFIAARVAAGRSCGTIRREMVFLHAAIRHGIKKKRVSKDFDFARLPRASDPRVVFLDDEQIAHLYTFREQMGERLYRFYRIAFATAQRARHIELLQVGRVHFDRNVIDFRIPRRRYKNKRTGEVPIAAELLPDLRAWCEGRAPDEYVIGVGVRGACSTLYHKAQKVMKLAGFWKKGFPPRHVTRKTWASQAAMADIPSKKMEQILWDKAATIDKSYAFLRPSEAQVTINFKQRAAPLAVIR